MGLTRFAGQPDYERVRQRRHERREAIMPKLCPRCYGLFTSGQVRYVAARVLSNAARIEAVATAARPHHEDPPMLADEIRFLSAYDRWATRQVLTVLDGLDPAVWRRSTVPRRPETMQFWSCGSS
jgi:hypothetical protein